MKRSSAPARTSWLASLGSLFTRPKRHAPRPRGSWLVVEQLEERTVLAADLTYDAVTDALTIDITGAAETLTLSADGGFLNLSSTAGLNDLTGFFGDGTEEFGGPNPISEIIITGQATGTQNVIFATGSSAFPTISILSLSGVDNIFYTGTNEFAEASTFVAETSIIFSSDSITSLTAASGTYLFQAEAGTVTVQDDATIDVTADADLTLQAFGSVNLTGSILAEDGNVELNGSEVNVISGAITAGDGTISLIATTDAVFFDGSILLEAATLEITGVTSVTASGSIIVGDGSVTIDGGGDFSLSGDLWVGNGPVSITADEVHFNDAAQVLVEDNNLTVTGDAIFFAVTDPDVPYIGVGSGTVTLIADFMRLNPDPLVPPSIEAERAVVRTRTVDRNIFLGTAAVNSSDATLNLTSTALSIFDVNFLQVGSNVDTEFTGDILFTDVITLTGVATTLALLTSDAGTISIEDTTEDGLSVANVRAETAGGIISLDATVAEQLIRISGNFAANAGAGAITVRNQGTLNLEAVDGLSHVTTIGGNITLESFTGSVTSTASGNISTVSATDSGIDSGNVEITAQVGVSLVGTINVNGSDQTAGGAAGNAGNLEINATTGDLTFTNNLYANGGNVTGGAGTAGDGGTITLEATAGSITATFLYANGGSISGGTGRGGAGGTVILTAEDPALRDDVLDPEDIDVHIIDARGGDGIEEAGGTGGRVRATIGSGAMLFTNINVIGGNTTVTGTNDFDAGSAAELETTPGDPFSRGQVELIMLDADMNEFNEIRVTGIIYTSGGNHSGSGAGDGGAGGTVLVEVIDDGDGGAADIHLGLGVGGEIDTSGGDVLDDGTGAGGQGGSLLINQHNSAIELGETILIGGNGNGADGGNAGNLTIVYEGTAYDVDFFGQVDARGGTGTVGGDGGTLEIEAGSFDATQLLTTGGEGSTGDGGRGGDITVTANYAADDFAIEVLSINSAGGDGVNGGIGGEVHLSVTADGITTGAITTSGGAGDTGDNGNTGGNAGAVSLLATSGLIEVTDDINALGGIGDSGGDGGSVTITSSSLTLDASNVSIAADIDTRGATGSNGGGGDGGPIILTGTAIEVGALISFGGDGSVTDTDAEAGDGGDITLTSTVADIVLNDNLNSHGGTADIGGKGGDVLITAAGAFDGAGLLYETYGGDGENGAGGNGGSLEITSASQIGAGLIDTHGGEGATTGGHGGEVTLETAAGTIEITGNVLADGGIGGSGIGGNGGVVTLENSGGAILTEVISSTGADGGTDGGNGGAIDVLDATVFETNAINANGGQGFGGNGGVGGPVTITADSVEFLLGGIQTWGNTGTVDGGDGGEVRITALNGAVDLNMFSITTHGGISGTGAGGDGGLVDVSATAGITIADIDTYGREGGPTGTSGGIGGNVELTSTGSAAVAIGAIDTHGNVGGTAGGGAGGTVFISNTNGSVTTADIATYGGEGGTGSLGTGGGGGFITIAAGTTIEVGNLDSSGAAANGTGDLQGGAGGTVQLTTDINDIADLGDITVGTILTSGGASVGDATGVDAGDVTVTSNPDGIETLSAVVITSITAVGGGAETDTAGTGGSIVVQVDEGTITISGAVNAVGGEAGTGSGGTGGSFSAIIDDSDVATSTISVTGAIDVSGGTGRNGGSANTTQAVLIQINDDDAVLVGPRGTGTITLSGNVSANGGLPTANAGGAGGSGGPITIAHGATGSITTLNLSAIGTSADATATAGAGGAGGRIAVTTVDGSVDTGTVNTSGGNSRSATGNTFNGGTAGQILINAFDENDDTVAGTHHHLTTLGLTANGGAANSSDGLASGNGGAGASVEAVLNEGVLLINGAISATGGFSALGTGGNGGAVLVAIQDTDVGVSSVTIAGSVTVDAGDGATGGTFSGGHVVQIRLGDQNTTTGGGNIVVQGAISSTGGTGTTGAGGLGGGFQSFNRAGDVQLVSVAIDGGGGETFGSQAGANVDIDATGAITITGAITATGGTGGTGAGGLGSAVVIDSSGSSVSVASINTSGGLGTTGGIANQIDLSAATTFTASGALSAMGGVGTAGAGGNGSYIDVESSGGNVTVTTVNTSGGSGTTGGNAARIDLTAPTTLTLNGDLFANGGNVGSSGNAGTIELVGSTVLGNTISVQSLGDADGAGDVTFFSDVNATAAGGQGLAVSANDVTTFVGNVGNTTPLAFLTTNGGGTTVFASPGIATADVTTTGTQTYLDQVVLGTGAGQSADTRLVSTTSNVVFGPDLLEIDAGRTLMLTTATRSQLADDTFLNGGTLTLSAAGAIVPADAGLFGAGTINVSGAANGSLQIANDGFLSPGIDPDLDNGTAPGTPGVLNIVGAGGTALEFQAGSTYFAQIQPTGTQVDFVNVTGGSSSIAAGANLFLLLALDFPSFPNAASNLVLLTGYSSGAFSVTLGQIDNANFITETFVGLQSTFVMSDFENVVTIDIGQVNLGISYEAGQVVLNAIGSVAIVIDSVTFQSAVFAVQTITVINVPAVDQQISTQLALDVSRGGGVNQSKGQALLAIYELPELNFPEFDAKTVSEQRGVRTVLEEATVELTELAGALKRLEQEPFGVYRIAITYLDKKKTKQRIEIEITARNRAAVLQQLNSLWKIMQYQQQQQKSDEQPQSVLPPAAAPLPTPDNSQAPVPVRPPVPASQPAANATSGAKPTPVAKPAPTEYDVPHLLVLNSGVSLAAGAALAAAALVQQRSSTKKANWQAEADHFWTKLGR